MIVRTLYNIFFYILCTSCAVQSACIHDDIQVSSKDVPRKVLNYDDSATNAGAGQRQREKRQADGRFIPIRIHVEFTNLETELTITESSLLQTIVQRTVNKASRILSVIPVQGPLVLKRGTSSCEVKWMDGINAGKCAKASVTYTGEVCRNANDNFNIFKIPDEHVEGLYVYDYNHEEPVRELYPPGDGVADTDYILYVQAASTNLCVNNGANVIAYATYCQTDHRSRPIAGYANFCPEFIRTMGSDESRVEITSLHELFHALGFTRELFGKFRQCPGQNCEVRTNPVRQAFGATRLVTPKVVDLASSHFGCSTQFTDNEFGPILQTKGPEVMSHWDAAFMQGSLMAPNIGLPHQTILDVITLAVFEDSGWYRVDYSKAEPFKWGKGGGCNFALQSNCQEGGPYFCEEGSCGCHYLHLDKGKCDTDNFLHGCKIIKSKPEDSCQYPGHHHSGHPPPGRPPPGRSPSYGHGSGEQYEYNSRCFLSNLTLDSQDSCQYPGHHHSGHPPPGRPPPGRSPSYGHGSGEQYEYNSRCFLSNLTLDSQTFKTRKPKAQCYQHQCMDDILQVKVGDSPWIDCSHQMNIRIPGYEGILVCPADGILCQPQGVTQSPESEPEPEVSHEPPYLAEGKTDIFCIEISFKNANYNVLWKNQQLTTFKNSLVEQVCSVTGITTARMNQIQVFEGSVVFSFNLLPSRGDDDGPASEDVYKHLMALINAGNFTVHLPLDGVAYSASAVRRTDGGPKVKPSPLPAGVIAGIAIGSILAAAIIGTLVFFVQRYYAVHAQVDPRQQNTSQRHDNQYGNQRRQNTLNEDQERHDISYDNHNELGRYNGHEHRTSAHDYGRIRLPPGYWDRHRHGHPSNYYHGPSSRYSDNGDRQSIYSNYSDRQSNYSVPPPSIYESSSGASVFDAAQSDRNSQMSNKSGNHHQFLQRSRSVISTTDIVMEELDPYTLKEEDFDAV